MRQFKPIYWPVPVIVRDELKPTKRGRRAASNYGLWIVMSKDAMERKPWILEQEKYESRYWALRPWRWLDFFWFHFRPSQRVMIRPAVSIADKVLLYRICKAEKAAAHLSRVECASRAQEIRARAHPWDDWLTGKLLARSYARSIHSATNYPFFDAAGWDEEDVYNEITRQL